MWHQNIILVWRKNDGATEFAVHAGFADNKYVRVECPSTYNHFAVSGREGCDFVINSELTAEAEKILLEGDDAWTAWLAKMAVKEAAAAASGGGGGDGGGCCTIL